MKLVKINTDHYVIVDDSEIKDGDWIYWEGKIVKAVDTSYWSAKKITHSTNILTNGMGILYLSEVKELIGKGVDVEKKAYDTAFKFIGTNDEQVQYLKSLILEFYNQAIEDNKDKKYTEEDIQLAIDFGFIQNATNGWIDLGQQKSFIQSLQQKTEWEVEFDSNGKLKLV